MGGFCLTTDAIPVTSLDHPRLQALLAYLVLQRAMPQSRQHLAFLLWPDSTEAQARANLRTLLHRLRQALPLVDTFLHIDAQTVQWRADAPWTLDLGAFEQALAQADQAEQRGDQAAAHAALQEAVVHYHGDLLPGWYDDWVLVERERLHRAFLAALERLIWLLEQQHDYAAAIVYAQRLLRHDPLHEVAYQYLIRLHGLSGDRASALRVYQTCVTVLERELGVEPSPATRDTYERILNLEVAAAFVERPAPPAPRQQRNNLPLALTSFVGWTQEIAEVSRLLARTRLLTLTGAGGCGKTRLALAVAEAQLAAYPDGVWLVELASLTDAALVPQAVATTLGVREEPQHSLTATLLEALHSRDMLLLLDNCEHLIDACAQLATTLLGACPQLHILATSREALGIAGETTCPVPSLALPDIQQSPRLEELVQVEAVRLFVERALATLPTFTLVEANAATVAHLCRRLDGIPLAIELAAARIKLLSVEQLAERLDDCMRLLTSGSRTALPRQQTLRAAIDWSYNLLTEAEWALFRRLAVFAGGWTLEAAEAVCSEGDIAEDVVLELLAHLVDKSLVVVETQHGGAVRYRLLEPMRQYAQEKLREAEDANTIRQQHAGFFLVLAETAEPELRGAQQIAWLERLEAEHDNLRVILGWTLEQKAAEINARLSGALWRFWYTRSYLSEGRRWLDAALTLLDGSLRLSCGGSELPDQAHYQQRRLMMAVRAKVLGGAGGLAWGQGAYTDAETYYQEGLALARELGDQAEIARLLNGLGVVAMYQADYRHAERFCAESLALFRALEDTWGIATTLSNAGAIAQLQNDYPQAQDLYTESLRLRRQLQDRLGMSIALVNLGEVALRQGDYARAREVYREGLALCGELGAKAAVAYYLEGLATIAGAQSQLVHAARLYGAAAMLRKAIGAPLPSADHSVNERLVAEVRNQLDPVAWAEAWAAGWALPLEQAIAEALRITDSVIPRPRETTA
jgi:non-specific serine/threonine protein kinase